MELAEGGDLFDKVEADIGVSQDIAHVYFTELINVVGYMHFKGVGHRDLKPKSVLLSTDGDPKLANFGIATFFYYGGKKKIAITLCGSPPYVAPEVLTCGALDGKAKGNSAYFSDICLCGVVLFVLLAGNRPRSKPVERKDEYGSPNAIFGGEESVPAKQAMSKFASIQTVSSPASSSEETTEYRPEAVSPTTHDFSLCLEILSMKVGRMQ